MNGKYNCVDCGNVFFGYSTFGNGLGVCNVCHSSRQANERFEKEMAARKNERQFSHSYSGSSVRSEQSTTSLGFGIVVMLALCIFAIISLVSHATSSNKEYSFYTPNDGTLKQTLTAGKVYDQYNCDRICTPNPEVDIKRFCHEFDGINTIDNGDILEDRTGNHPGKITSLSREVDTYSNGKPFCRIKFTMIDDKNGKTKTGVAVVGSWTLNSEGKLVPFSTMGLTYWK